VVPVGVGLKTLCMMSGGVRADKRWTFKCDADCDTAAVTWGV